MDEVTQDFGLRWSVNRKVGNVYATFNRNVYNDRVNSLVIDNPFQAADVAFKAASGSIPASRPCSHSAMARNPWTAEPTHRTTKRRIP